jgi:hypothetical protein
MDMRNYFDLNKIKVISENDKDKSNQYMKYYFNESNLVKRKKYLMNAFHVNPKNTNALVQLGMTNITSQNRSIVEDAFYLLEQIFSSQYVDDEICIHIPPSKYILSQMSRYYFYIHYYDRCYKYLDLCEQSNYMKDDSQMIQKCCFIHGFYKKNEIKPSFKKKSEYYQYILKKPTINIEYSMTIYGQEGFDKVYNYLFLSPFNLEIYYEINFNTWMNNYYNLIKKTFNVFDVFETKYIKKQKIKLGIISAFFYPSNSVIEDFKNMINRLPEDLFDITYIFVPENVSNERHFVYKHKKHILISNQLGNNWYNHAKFNIVKEQFDILFYPESTMSSKIYRLCMNKLAYKQCVSHGHPVTTGITNDIMNYFISWEASELPYEQSKKHYSETLLWIPKESMHQYYEPRLKNNISKISNQSCFDIDRDYFSDYVPSDGNWYLCMQKPFKLHPIFYESLVKILEKDPKARILLHKENNRDNHEICLQYFRDLSGHLSRVHWIPCLEHHRLMSLYKLSNVVLDSYYAGGCTTSREAMEIGKVIITKPEKYLGGRWTYAYYNKIGINDFIARDYDHYVDLALEIGTNIEKQIESEKKIRENVHKLFYCKESVESWVNIFKSMLIKT